MAVEKQRLDRAEPEPSYDIARVVRLLMRLTDSNLDALAAALGVGKSQASARLNGHTRWAADDVARLAQLWGVDPGLFFLPIEEVKPRIFESITQLKAAITGKDSAHLAVIASNRERKGRRRGPPLVASVTD